jgi:hypothetical protein
VDRDLVGQSDHLTREHRNPEKWKAVKVRKALEHAAFLMFLQHADELRAGLSTLSDQSPVGARRQYMTQFRGHVPLNHPLIATQA